VYYVVTYPPVPLPLIREGGQGADAPLRHPQLSKFSSREVVLKEGGFAPLFFSSPSPRMERGIKGVRLENNPFELFWPSKYNNNEG
jgi:hypothetical protein